MGLGDHIRAQRESLTRDITLGEGIVWTVQLKRLSPAEVVLTGGQLWGTFAESEVARALANIRSAVADEQAGMQAEVMTRALARQLTEPPHAVRDRAAKVRQQAEAAVCAAVEAIDTHDGDGMGLEPVKLTTKAPRDGEVSLSDLPPAFVNAVFPHIRTIATDGVQEVAAVMARFRDDAAREAGEGGERAPVDAGDAGAADAVG